VATVIRLTPAAGRTALPEGETPEAGPARRQFIRHGLPWQWAGQSLGGPELEYGHVSRAPYAPRQQGARPKRTLV